MVAKSKKTQRIAVFCSGNGSNLQAILAAEKKGTLKAEVVAVLSDQPSAFGLKRANRAKKVAVLIEPKYFKSRQDFEKAVVKVLKELRIDIVVLAGFMRILTPYFLKNFKNRILNIHPSLLPAFKGAHAIRDAFKYGVKVTGVTVHVATEDLDAGPILAQKAIEIRQSDTEKTLAVRIHKTEHILYPQVIRDFATKRLKPIR